MNDVGMTIVACGDLHVAIWLHTANDPPPAQWKEAQERVAELKRKLGGDTSKIVTLAISDGGTPNSVQRGEYNTILENKAKTSGVTTQLSNRFIRGVATALGWLNPNFKAFAPDQFAPALEHLGVADHRGKIILALQKLQETVAPVQALAAVLAAERSQR